jgi:hypothetical protein
MVRKSQARYTTIITPAGTDYETANALALEKAKSLVNEGEQIAMGGVLSFTGTPIPDQPGMEEWQVEVTVLPPAESEPPGPPYLN